MKSSSKKPSSLLKVAKVVDAHSLKGEVKVHVFSGDVSWLDKVQRIYLKKSQERINPAPSEVEASLYSIENAKFQSGKLIMKLKGVADRTAAENLKGSDIYIDESVLISEPGENFFLGEILGFTVFNGSENIGQVSGFDSNLAQDILQVEMPDGHKALVPLIKEFIVKIDHTNKAIHMNLPEGLLEANREI